MTLASINPHLGGRKPTLIRPADPRTAVRPLIVDTIAHIDQIRLHVADFPAELDGLHDGIRQLPRHNTIRLTCPSGRLMERGNVEWISELQRKSQLSSTPRERMTHNYEEFAFEAGTKDQRDADLLLSQSVRQRVMLRHPPRDAYELPIRISRHMEFGGQMVWTNAAYWAPQESDKNLCVYSTRPKHFEFGCRIEIRLRGEVLRRLVPTLADTLVLNPRLLFKRVVDFGHTGLLPLIPTTFSWS